MGALRTIGCPGCSAAMRTKAIGRQTLACRCCGRRFFARDGVPQERSDSLRDRPVIAASQAPVTMAGAARISCEMRGDR